MPQEGFEPTISAGERQQTYALDRAVTGTDFYNLWGFEIFYCPTRIDVYAQQFFIQSYLQNTESCIKKPHNIT